MPLYFFDIHDGAYFRDDTGTECLDHESARLAAIACLPGIASATILNRGDKQSFSVMVRDAEGAPVYSASLNFVGVKLNGVASADLSPPPSRRA